MAQRHSPIYYIYVRRAYYRIDHQRIDWINHRMWWVQWIRWVWLIRLVLFNSRRFCVEMRAASRSCWRKIYCWRPASAIYARQSASWRVKGISQGLIRYQFRLNGPNWFWKGWKIAGRKKIIRILFFLLKSKLFKYECECLLLLNYQKLEMIWWQIYHKSNCALMQTNPNLGTQPNQLDREEIYFPSYEKFKTYFFTIFNKIEYIGHGDLDWLSWYLQQYSYSNHYFHQTTKNQRKNPRISAHSPYTPMDTRITCAGFCSTEFHQKALNGFLQSFFLFLRTGMKSNNSLFHSFSLGLFFLLAAAPLSIHFRFHFNTISNNRVKRIVVSKFVLYANANSIYAICFMVNVMQREQDIHIVIRMEKNHSCWVAFVISSFFVHNHV